MAQPAPAVAAEDATLRPAVDASFEVATTSADTLRASIRVAGPLTRSACSVLVCVLRTHLRAGRHYLRVDVTGAAEIDADAVGALADVHRQVAASGGMLAFEHARPRVLDALRNATLLVRTGS